MKKISLLKTILSFVCLCQILSCTSPQRESESPLREPSGIAKARRVRHHVLIIHGIAELESSTAGLADILAQLQLHRDANRKPTYIPKNVAFIEEFVPHVFQYQTASPKKQVYDFAVELNEFVKEKIFNVGGFSPDDKISIVGYSQGGLVGLVWAYLNLREGDAAIDPKGQLKDDGFIYKKAIEENLRNYITLGTPFWGSAVAAFAVDKDSWAAKIVSALVGPMEQLLKKMSFSVDELNGLHFGNKLYHTMREAAVKESDDLDSFSKLMNHVRILNVGGVMSAEKHPDFKGWNADFDELREKTLDRNQLSFAKIARYVDGEGDPYLESDLVVSLPNTRLGFLLQKADSSGYQEGEVTPDEKAREVHFGRHVIVEAPHMDLESYLKPFDAFQKILDLQPVGIAEISKGCAEEVLRRMDRIGLAIDFSRSNCMNYHPSLFFVINHLFEEEHTNVYAVFPRLLQMERQMKTFTVDFNISLAQGRQTTVNRLKVEIEAGSHNKEFVKIGSKSIHHHMHVVGDPRVGTTKGNLFRTSYIGYSRGAWMSPGHRPTSLSGVENYEEKFFTRVIRARVSGTDLAGKKLKSRWIEVPVRPTFASYVDVQLE